MKKILLICVLITIASNACKVRKAIHTTTKTVDSTSIVHQQSHVQSLTRDTSSINKLSNFLNIVEQKNLSIDKITVTDEDVPPSAIIFNVDSLTMTGDTGKVYASNGTEVSLFKNAKGQNMAKIEPKSGHKRVLEVQGIKLSATNNITSGDSAKQINKAKTVQKDTTGKENNQTHVQAKQKDKDKNVQKSTDMLKLTLWIGGVAVVIVLVVWLYKKFKSKIPI